MNDKCLNEFLDVAEASERYGSTTEGIRKAIKEGRLRAVKKSGAWLIHRSDFERFKNEK